MDLAEQIDDFIPSLQSSHSEMDSLIMLIFVVTTATLFFAWLGRFLYQKYTARKAAAAATAAATPTTTTTTASTPVTPSNAASVATSPLVAKSAAGTPSRPAMGGSPFSSGFGGGGGGGASRPMPVAKSRSMSNQSLNAGVRKRLTRKSPGPELGTPRRSRSIPPPASVAGPDDTTATWTSHVFKWLYSDLVIVNDLLYGFITSINQSIARNTSENENGILIEIVRVLPESTPPNISNIFCDKSAASNVSEVTITMDVENTIVLQIKAFRQVAGKADVLHYRATIRFRGHLSISMNYMTLVGEMRIEGYPDIKIGIAPVGPIKVTGKEEKDINDMINETLNLTIREVIYPVDFSMHATCPRALKMEPDSYYDNQHMDFPNPYDYMDHHMQMPYGSVGNYSNHQQQMQQPQQMSSAGRRLLVKIVKGEMLMQAKDPYVTVEMDEPPQKNQTGARQGSSPFWDEHFLFDLSNASSEILFEVYDRPANPNEYPKFLGLGLVGIDELAVGPSSSQTIALQPRPYETDPVSGAITVEFVFIEGAQVPVGPRRPYKLKEALKVDPRQMDQMSYEAPQHNINPRMSPMLQQQHLPQQQQPYLNGNDRHLNVNPNSLSPRTTSPSNDPNSLRPIQNYSSQRHSASVANGSKSYPYDNMNNSGSSNNVSPTMSAKAPVTSTPIKSVNSNNTLNMKISMIQQEKESSAEPQITGSVAERGREQKKTTIFGTLRKRLSRSKTRNEDTNGNTTNGYNGSDMTSSANSPVSPDSLPQSKSSSLKSPTGTLSRLGFSGSRRSSVSEMSGMSGLSRMSSISNKTFLHEASSLVLEVIENGVKRHYLVPMNIAQKPRWRRKGTKLHIYNDHTFIAKHLTSGLICEICMQSIPFRMGKQGYECRDCLLKCHKQCHVRTPQLCPKPTIQSIELCKISENDTAIRKF